MSKSKIRQATVNQGPHIKAHEAPEINYDKLKPAFSIHHVNNNRYCLTQCVKDEKAAFADTIHRLSKLTWGQIKCSPREGLGFEIMSIDALRTELPLNVTPDTKLLVFRFFSGNARMIGYRDKQIFHVIWFDPRLILYKH